MSDRSADRDDGRVVAQMDDVVRPPLLLPRFEAVRRRREAKPESAQTPVQLDKSERRAMIGGAVSAALLAGLILFLAFAVLIVILLKIWG